jgi:uncharacterized protein (TIGR00255 family)
MALSGMTGFARAEGERDGVRWIWEARSVNGRGLDLKFKLPQGFEGLEPTARATASKRFRRGSIQVSLTVRQEAEAPAAPKLNVAYIEELIAAGRPFIETGKIAPPSWEGLLGLRGVLIAQENGTDAPGSELESEIAASLNMALDSLQDVRRKEGQALGDILLGLLARIENLVVEAKSIASVGPQAIQDRIRTRLEALAPDVQFDPQRLAQEAAIAAMRADVQEELDRLGAHALEARALLTQEEPAGRRLDFLAQEFTREANTLCSKSQDLALTRLGLDLKTAIDQLREQAANVE